MHAEFLVWLGLYFCGMAIRGGYEHLKKTGRIQRLTKSIFVVIFIAMCMMWASWFSMCPLDPWQLQLPDSLRFVGFGMFILGLILAVGTFIQLRGLEDINRLVTVGLFAKLRHPMYAGFVLWIIGWALYHGAVISFAAGLIGIANIVYWARMEETAMLSKFGDAYRRYRRTTWI